MLVHAAVFFGLGLYSCVYVSEHEYATYVAAFKCVMLSLFPPHARGSVCLNCQLSCGM